MKLYLGSYRITDPAGLEKLVDRPLEGLSVAVIGNAKDAKPSEERIASLRQVHASLGTLGLVTANIDLRDISQATETNEAMNGFDMVFVTGGNSFVLRESMRRSGFDTAIHELVDTNLVYCGESAGAVVAGTTITSAEVEDTSAVSELIFEGLGLIDRIIVPHANWRRRADYIEQMVVTYGERLLTLRDDQAHIVDQ
jgi:dipeptidase E